MTFYLVATPIGNLHDMSERAKATLASVHTILCEDTRVTHKLLENTKISTPHLVSYHQHSDTQKFNHIVRLIEDGHDLALVTDAGTPGISDPGGQLVEALVKRFGGSLAIVPIPGPSALICALSASGMPADKFVFLGFPPIKNGRQKFFDHLADFDLTIVFYESTHRILKTLGELDKRFPDRKVVVCRELTKLHETIYRGTAAEVTKQLGSTSIKGEFVVVL
ncbi:16S rRNA (cytidine(1402)-2'-O)-methyltransferase [Candidatus Uhrbacteria bacterium]|nr:16S rRNA (cytidine(1402)-2'-O)-methyltransferase [Candidatus Uhrbacteria bacterium]